MHLIAEVLDKQVLDSTGQNAGKADGVVAALRAGQPPILVGIEVGPITLLRRISRRLARWYQPLDARFGAERGKPFLIEWSKLEVRDPTLRARLEADATPIFAAERFARALICHIPGG
jgi:hypothetical protein